MTDPGPDYKLTTADSAAFCALVQARAPYAQPRQPEVLACFSAVGSMAYDHYRSVANAQVKAWTDKFFSTLVSTQTCYGISAAGLYVLYAYSQFARTCFVPQDSGPGPWRHGFPDQWDQRGGTSVQGAKPMLLAAPWDRFAGATGLWRPPGSPASFSAALGESVTILNDVVATQPVNLMVALFTGCGGAAQDLASVVQFEESRFDPQNWADSSMFLSNLEPLWQEQSRGVNYLLQQGALTGEAYFFLLHLLMALSTSTAIDQELAEKIVRAAAGSVEYSDGTFIDQLVYVTLMYLADPFGDLHLGNTELQAEMAALSGAITSHNPASQAIGASLGRYQRLLSTDAAYPMQDPYCPDIGFSQRKTDTLYALDRGRQGLRA
jgi:hypothetical protein